MTIMTLAYGGPVQAIRKKKCTINVRKGKNIYTYCTYLYVGIIFQTSSHYKTVDGDVFQEYGNRLVAGDNNNE